MIFVDNVEINIIAGKGGNGKLSFRHEIYIAKGGPDGGDGGNGGSIIFRASRNQNTLTAFRYQKELKAEDGHPGGTNKKHGKSGQNLIVDVPVGTVISEVNGKILADLVEDEQQAILAKGGNGGYGNAHFISSRRQAPNFAEKGEPGEEKDLRLEIKMIADVGLVGLPNAGKSTFLARVSNATPEIANYPFTTLTPNLGVADIDKKSSLLIADIPGLIEGASEGKGLGHDFLRHIERTKVILHLIDAYNDDIPGSYLTVKNELKAYNSKLAKRKEIIALTKIEGLDIEIINDEINQLKRVVSKSAKIVPISSSSGEGIKDVLYQLQALVLQKEKIAKKKEDKDELPILKIKETKDQWKITKKAGRFVILGESIEKFALKTNYESDEGLTRLRDIMRRKGIMHELRRKKIESGDIIQIGPNPDSYFTY